MVNIEWIIFTFNYKVQMISDKHLLINMNMECSKQL